MGQLSLLRTWLQWPFKGVHVRETEKEIALSLVELFVETATTSPCFLFVSKQKHIFASYVRIGDVC